MNFKEMLPAIIALSICLLTPGGAGAGSFDGSRELICATAFEMRAALAKMQKEYLISIICPRAQGHSG